MDKWMTGSCCNYPINNEFYKNRNAVVYFYFLELLDKLMSMFEYDGLPDNIYEPFLQYVMFLNGNIGWVNVDNKLRIVDGNPGGPPNEYYIPSEYVWANPVLGSGIEKIGETCVVGFNNSVHSSIAPMLFRYANMLADNDISINIAQVNTRLQVFFTATTEAERKSAEDVIKKLINGDIGVALEGSFLAGIKSNPIAENAKHGTITELIELHQYTLANYYHAIGINSNYNMKRERLNSNEININDEVLRLNLADMYKCRVQMCDAVNEMFGTNISVKINSAFTELEPSFAGETIDDILQSTSDEVENQNKESVLTDEVTENETLVNEYPEENGEQNTDMEELQEAIDEVQEKLDDIKGDGGE